jgi:hypothetical protein
MKSRKICVLVAVLLLFLSLALPWLAATALVGTPHEFTSYHFPFWAILTAKTYVPETPFSLEFGLLWLGLSGGITALLLWIIFHLFSCLIGIIAYFKNKWIFPTVGLTCLSLASFLIGISQLLSKWNYYVTEAQISYGFFCSCFSLILLIISLMIKNPSILIMLSRKG